MSEPRTPIKDRIERRPEPDPDICPDCGDLLCHDCGIELPSSFHWDGCTLDPRVKKPVRVN